MTILNRIHFFYPSILILLVAVCMTPALLLSQNLPDTPHQYVNDYAGLLGKQEIASLNEMLRAYEDSTSNQFVVAIFTNAQGYPVEEFSIRLAEKWKVGQKDRENGLIMAIFLEERAIRIEVGYGLEDVIPDAVAFEVAQRVIPPYFREEKYYEGIQQGMVALFKAAAGKYQGNPDAEADGIKNWMPLLIFIIILILVFRRQRFSMGSSGGWRNGGPFYWGGFGGSSRSSGGGFGGFSAGGGSFGGGGATGRW